ncbi:hypothetical protein TNCV_3733771 [Trichonephila clavipes]|nr:hypothetical protein TNCV_3733771 [Trichonephila clavipes]
MEVTRFEQRSYLKISVLRGKNAMEYHSELVEVLGNNALSYRTVARWVYCVIILLHREDHITLYTTKRRNVGDSAKLASILVIILVTVCGYMDLLEITGEIYLYHDLRRKRSFREKSV